MEVCENFQMLRVYGTCTGSSQCTSNSERSIRSDIATCKTTLDSQIQLFIPGLHVQKLSSIYSFTFRLIFFYKQSLCTQNS